MAEPYGRSSPYPGIPQPQEGGYPAPPAGVYPTGDPTLTNPYGPPIPPSTSGAPYASTGAPPYGGSGAPLIAGSGPQFQSGPSDSNAGFGNPGYGAMGQPGVPPMGQPGVPPMGQPGVPPMGQPGVPPMENKVDLSATGVGVGAGNVVPSAPTENMIIPGYEEMHPENDFSMAPPAYELPEQEKMPFKKEKNFELSDDEAREALLEYVAKHCCYGSGAAKDMKMKDIISISALHYTLETYLETRSTKWSHKPYNGGIVDGPMNGRAPEAWEIPQLSSKLFDDQIYRHEVPHTAYVTTCPGCLGMGFVRCTHCHGRGTTRCGLCGGDGTRANGDRCHTCHGDGRRRCTTCHGRGQVICSTCLGSGKVKKFILLTVQFKNYVASHVIEKTDLPDHLIRNVTGEIVFEQTAPYVAPVTGYPNDEIDIKSGEFVQQHSGLPNIHSGRVIQQRQKLQCVPVFETHFKYKGDKGRFWVYGLQHEVYTDDYPHTCCCCAIC